MEAIEGTVTISIKQFDELRQQAERVAYLEAQMDVLKAEVDRLYTVDQEEWEEENRKIDADRNITEKELDRRVDEARSKIKIVMDKERTVAFIKKYLPAVKEIEIDDARREIKRTKAEELKIFQMEIG